MFYKFFLEKIIIVLDYVNVNITKKSIYILISLLTLVYELIIKVYNDMAHKIEILLQSLC